LSLSSKFVRDALDVIHVFPAGLQGIANIMLAWVRMSPHGSGVGLLEQHQAVYARLRGLCETNLPPRLCNIGSREDSTQPTGFALAAGHPQDELLTR
jgi:hypothetical protein